MISYFEIWKECGRGEEGEGGRIEGERKKRVKNTINYTYIIYWYSIQRTLLSVINPGLYEACVGLDFIFFLVHLIIINSMWQINVG